jgi:hypothetical protein
MDGERRGASRGWAIVGGAVVVALTLAGAGTFYIGQHAATAALLFLAVLTLSFMQRKFQGEFARLAQPYWWPALIIAALAGAIILNDQVRDLLEAATLEPVGGDVGLTNTLWWLLAASAYFGFTAWTFLRLASEFGDRSAAPTGSGPEPTHGWRHFVQLQAARIAGVALPLVIAVRYFQLGSQAAGGPANNPYLRESIAFLLLGIGLFLVFWLRRVVIDKENALTALVGRKKVIEKTDKIRGSAPILWLLVLAAVHVVLLGLTIGWGIDAPSKLGAPALVIFACAGFLGVGWMLFTYLPYRTKWPAVPVFFFGWLLIMSVWNDNHRVRVLEDVADFAPRAPVDADAYARAWLADRERLMQAGADCAPWPIFVVAAEGGGVRAAYWTGAVLGRLEEETRGLAEGCGSFADHVFMISGVSGGALGAAAFAAALKDGWDEPSETGARGDEARNPRLAAREFLKHDFLSPTVASLVYPDALARFWFLDGRTVERADRARWMERAWETRWSEETLGSSFSTEYRALWSEGRVAEILDRAAALARGEEPAPLSAEAEREPVPPVLAFNTTSVQMGAKWVLGPVRFESAAAQLRVCESGQFEDLEAGPISLATAVHLSARFTYISPAGRVDTAEACREDDAEERSGPATQYMRFVDGGYFEDSGAHTAFEAIAALRRVLLEECGANPDARVYCRAPIVPLAITTETSPPRDRPPRFAPELRSPLSAVFAAREARGFAARRLFSVSGDRVGAAGLAPSRALEPLVGRADEKGGPATRSAGGASGGSNQLYIDIHLPREWSGPCTPGGGASETARRDAYDTPYAICERDGDSPRRLLPLGWTLSQWAAERMDQALDAQFQRDGCGFAAAALVFGGSDARATLQEGAPLGDGRCNGIRWFGASMRSAS